MRSGQAKALLWVAGVDRPWAGLVAWCPVVPRGRGLQASLALARRCQRGRDGWSVVCSALGVYRSV